MRNKIALIVFCLLFVFAGNVFEKITGEIIVRGKWGKEPGEFGLDISEPPGGGPSIFTVSPDSDIYIADCINSRIVVYNHEGKFLKSIKIPNPYHRYHYVNSIEVDNDKIIYYTDMQGLHILNLEGKEIASVKYRGVVHLDKGNIYLWRDGASSVLKLDKRTGKIGLLGSIKETAVELIRISNGIEFRRGPTSLSKKTGIAYITINGKPTPVKKMVKGKEVYVKADTSNPLKNLSDFSFLDGEDGNVYLENWGCVVRINSDGILTGKFMPTVDDEQYIAGLGYPPSGYARVKNEKIYYMGATDKEFMIIEYEFQPVE